MAYKFKPGKLTQKAVRKVAREQTSRALAALSKGDVTPVDIHEGRKVVKRLRSLLKLVEPALVPDDFKRRYKSIGRAGDLLASARDRHVMERTIQELESRFGPPAAAALAFMRKRFEAEKSGAPPGVDEAALERARAAFIKEARSLEKLKIKGQGLDLFAGGLEDTYRTARRNFAMAYAKPDDVRFHEFRKAVQWHWRHMALLSRAWPQYFGVRIDACQGLADALGDDHDLFMLLVAAEKTASGKPEFARLEGLVRRRQEELRAAAYAHAERLFAESPKSFRRRMELYWHAKMPLATAPEEDEGEATV